MIIRDAQFVISAVTLAQCPADGQPEITLSGRSNVGKSSLLNKLLQRRNLAHVSSNPGKTQTLNFYHINQSFYFVDLPGYGYAKVAKSVSQQWGAMIENYLENRQNLRLALQLIDIRHEPSQQDQIMAQYLRGIGKPFAVVMTKADKISKNAFAKQRSMIAKTLQLSESDPLFSTSSETGFGIEALWEYLESFVNLS
nr:YihA family ribosome biogenesis GTP-binding protein [Bacilli bacterium]